MGTTSSFFGGSGGGGDPTGKFQAAATVAEGDLVVLNDNGTVQPVTFSSVSANLSISDAQTNVGGEWKLDGQMVHSFSFITQLIISI